MPLKRCKNEHCNRNAVAQGYCHNHYRQARRKNVITILEEHQKKRCLHKCSKEEIITKSGWTPENIAWVAGIIEGEGSFHYTEKTARRLRIRMTDKDVLDKIKSILKIGTLHGPYKKKNPKHKDAWEFSVCRRKELIEICNAILPWMCKRRTSKIRYILEEHKNAITEMQER